MNFLNLLKLHFLITWSDKRGAVVTHGSVLPDSAQKTDFYSIVDNATVTSIIAADISASAGIQDSQLNTISTAGKVNVSALTGQIANANLAQITTAALVSGAALTLLPNIPSGAGLVPVANIGGLLGAWVSKTNNTTYLAATDLLVVCQQNGTGTIEFLTDSSSSPSTQRAYVNANGGTMTCFVRKGDYWVSSLVSGTNSVVIYQIAIGS